MRHGLRLAGFERLDVGFNPIKERHVGNGAVLDDFGQARTQFACRQSLQHCQITDHTLRLVKRANHVFAHGVVDGCFATHRRINLCQQGGWHLHEGHAAHETGCGKTRHVAHHTAAQCKQHGLAIAGLPQQAVKNQIQGHPIFVRFAIGQMHAVNDFVMGRKGLLERSLVQGRHRGVAHNQCRSRFGQVGIGGSLGQQVLTNDDVIASVGQINSNHFWLLRRAVHKRLQVWCGVCVSKP